jgi:hypothetical protein
MTPTTTNFRTVEVWVRCLDGEIRHTTPFLNKAEAERFAEWGHCCFGTHTLERVVEPIEPTVCPDHFVGAETLRCLTCGAS